MALRTATARIRLLRIQAVMPTHWLTSSTSSWRWRPITWTSTATGRSNVPATRPMPVPDDLAALLAS